MAELENPVYRFKGFELEPAERRLSQAGRSIALTPKVFDTLVLLVERAGHGKVEGFDVTLKLTPTAGDLSIDLNATKSIAGGTISVHGVATLNGLASEGSVTVADGATTRVEFDNHGLNGSVNFDWKVAFDADHGGSDPAMTMPVVSNLPFSLDFPFALGPIPFKVSFKACYALGELPHGHPVDRPVREARIEHHGICRVHLRGARQAQVETHAAQGDIQKGLYADQAAEHHPVPLTSKQRGVQHGAAECAVSAACVPGFEDIRFFLRVYARTQFCLALGGQGVEPVQRVGDRLAQRADSQAGLLGTRRGGQGGAGRVSAHG